MEINKIYNADCLEKLRQLEDNSIDLMFCDPPYALGSDITILPNGKPEYEKARDFMVKWEQPNGEFWEEWFKEANRVLKYGGHCLMFGLDRQLMLYKYYACFAGFVEKQSLYWYFISNFPKASDLSKNLDKNAGAERDSIPNPKAKQQTGSDKPTLSLGAKKGVTEIQPYAKTDLAKKYNGMKYSIATLKQTNETIMVFQKKYKTGSCMHDVIAMENGDSSITCGALDIENNRVGSERITTNGWSSGNRINTVNANTKEGIRETHTGRFPSQTICDSKTAAILDGQSGVRSSGTLKETNKTPNIPSSKGGCSKILHKCNYENNDYDIYNYCAKVSNAERNKGLSGMEKKDMITMREGKGNDLLDRFIASPSENHHPTVKPISLLRRILSYFKTPNKQIVLDCFVGSGSLPIACIEENMNYIGYELDTEYFEIAEKRIQDAQSQLKLF